VIDEKFQVSREKHTKKRFELCDRKSVEYARDRDRHANFKRMGRKFRQNPMLILGVYLTKHIDAIDEYIARSGKGEYVEPIEGRIHDAQNYLDLLLTLIEDLKEDV